MGWRRSRRPALKKQPNESNKLIWIQAQTLEVSVIPSAHMEALNFQKPFDLDIDFFFCGDAAERKILTISKEVIAHSPWTCIPAMFCRAHKHNILTVGP